MTETAFIVGESLVDVVAPPPPGPTTEHPGGSPLNVAVGLARLGRRTQLATRFADDNHGQIVRDHVESNGIQLCPSSDEALTTATATARLASDGQASYHFDLTWDLPRLSIPDEAIVVHTGSIASWTAPGRDHVRDVMGRAKEQATVTYDPNVRPDLLDDPESARPLIESCVSRADVVKASDEDLHWLHPGDDLRTIARHWLDLGPSLMVITCGGSGILALTDRGLSLSIPSHPAKVADTVGAGDSFMSGLLDGLWSAELLGVEHRDDLAAIDEATLRRILTRCAHIGAITVSRAGANPPTLADLGEDARN